jgi:hypothetical protein
LSVVKSGLIRIMLQRDLGEEAYFGKRAVF